MADPSQVPVVIMCGGKGTRIRGVSDNLPKPMVPIGPYPIVWHIMKIYSSFGFRKFILCLGYKGWDIKEYFLKYQSMTSDLSLRTEDGSFTALGSTEDEDWEIILAETGLETGTGGRLAKVAKYIDSDYFMCSYGDGVGDINLGQELSDLEASNHLGLVCGVHPTSRYGELEVEGDAVKSFAEKLPSQSWVSGGFFAFKRDFLRYLNVDDDSHFFEHDPLQKLTADGLLGLHKHTGFWMGMDTFREYSALNEMWAQDEATWKLWS